MNLVECIEAIKQHEKELVLFNLQTKASIIEDLRAYFGIQNMRITTATTASGRQADIAVLSNKETVLTLVDVALLQKLLDHTQTDDIGIADTRYEPDLETAAVQLFIEYSKECSHRHGDGLTALQHCTFSAPFCGTRIVNHRFAQDR